MLIYGVECYLYTNNLKKQECIISMDNLSLSRLNVFDFQNNQLFYLKFMQIYSIFNGKLNS